MGLKRLLPRIALLAPLLASACSNGAAAEENLDALNTDGVEFGATIDPNTGDLYFVRTDDAWDEPSRSTLLRSAKTDTGWTDPTPVFPELIDTGDPAIGPNGEFLYFTVAVERQDGSSDADIWRARRTPDGWAEPQAVEQVNSEGDEYSPVVSSTGVLYFASTRAGGFGQGDIWSAAPTDKGFAEPQNLGPAINTPTGEWNLDISPDGNLLIFEASGRETNESVSGDLYLSRRMLNGWSAAVPLRRLNTTGSDLMPRFSRDGQTLFYSSSRMAGSKHTDLFSIPVSDALSDAMAPLLAVASRSAHEVAIVSLKDEQVIARIPTGKGPHEVAVSADRNQLFIPAFGIFPTPHDQPIEPDQLSWSEGPSGDLTIWSMASGAGAKTAICRNAHAVAVTPNDGHLWITCEESGEVLELDRNGEEILRRWQSGGAGTHKLAVDPSGRFVIAANTQSANISLINRQKEQVTLVSTGPGAEGLSLSADGQNIWVGNTQDNSVSMVRIATGELVRTFPSEGRFPVNLTAVPGTDELWVVNTFSSSVSVFDGRNGQLVTTLQYPTPPLGILASPDGSHVVLSLPRRNALAVIDRRTRKEIKRIDGVMEGDGMAWLSIDGDRHWFKAE